MVFPTPTRSSQAVRSPSGSSSRRSTASFSVQRRHSMAFNVNERAFARVPDESIQFTQAFFDEEEDGTMQANPSPLLTDFDRIFSVDRHDAFFKQVDATSKNSPAENFGGTTSHSQTGNGSSIGKTSNGSQGDFGFPLAMQHHARGGSVTGPSPKHELSSSSRSDLISFDYAASYNPSNESYACATPTTMPNIHHHLSVSCPWVTHPPHVHHSNAPGTCIQFVDKALTTKPKSHQPLRALSAYNFFFHDERERLLHGGDLEVTDAKCAKLLTAHWTRDRTQKRRHRKTHGKISFTELSRIVSAKWKQIPHESKEFYRRVSAKDWERYQKELDKYKNVEPPASTMTVCNSQTASDFGRTDRTDRTSCYFGLD